MNTPIDAALHGYATRLLAGTGLTAAEAEAVASGQQNDVPTAAASAAEALRDGWAAAERGTTGQLGDAQPAVRP